MMKRILIPLLGLGVVVGSATLIHAQSTAKNDVKAAGQDVKKAAKKTGRAVKKGTKKGVHAGAKATRKASGKVEQKTEKKPR